MKFLRKALMLAGGLVVTAGTLAACGGQPPSAPIAHVTSSDQVSSTIDAAKVQKTLIIGVDNPYYVFASHILVAQEQGYFAEFGIENVELRTTDAVVEALVGGSLDFGLVDTDAGIAAAARTRGQVSYIAPHFARLPVVIGARAGIDSLADLRGSTFATAQFGSRADLLVRRALEANGLNPDTDLDMVNTGGRADQRLQSVLAGTVDAANLQTRHRTLLENAGGRFLYEENLAAPQNGWITRGALLSESPDTVAAFLAAMLQARAHILDPANQESVLNLVMANGYELNDAFRAEYQVENGSEWLPPDGGFEIADMQSFIADSVTLETVPTDVNWREAANLNALWTAQRVLGHDLRPSPEEFAG